MSAPTLSSQADQQELYAAAKAARESGKLSDAAHLLCRVVEGSPTDPAARYALAVCLRDLGDRAHAVAQFTAVLRLHPGHYLAAYQIGRLQLEQNDPAAARTSFDRALSIQDYPPARDGVAACEQRLRPQPPRTDPARTDPVRSDPPRTDPARADPASTLAHPVRSDPTRAVPVPADEADPARRPEADPASAHETVGDRTLAQELDEHLPAEPGAPLETCRVQLRHLAGVPAAATVLAVAATVVLERYPVPYRGVVVALLWAYAVAMAACAWLESRVSLFWFHERRVDVATGLLHRRRLVLWYYTVSQVTYRRTPLSYLTNTASLDITYLSTTTQTQTLTLPGIGSPDEVLDLYRRLQPLTVRERRRMKLTLT